MPLREGFVVVPFEVVDGWSSHEAVEEASVRIAFCHPGLEQGGRGGQSNAGLCGELDSEIVCGPGRVDHAAATDDHASHEQEQDAGSEQQSLLLAALIEMTGPGNQRGQDGGDIAILEIDFAVVDDDGRGSG